MKNLWFAAFFLLLSSVVKSQITYTPMTAAGYQFKYLKADSGFNVPNRDTSYGRGTRRGGSIVFDTTTRIFYGWDGIRWQPFVTGGGGTQIFYGIDSLTYYNNLICQWKAGVSTCYTVVPGVDSVTVTDSTYCQWINGDSTCFTIINNTLGTGIDSVTVMGSQICQWKAGVSTCYTITFTSNPIDSITIINNSFCIYIGGVPSCITLNPDTVYVKDDLYVVWDSTGHQVIGRLHDDGLVWGGRVTGAGGMNADVTPAFYYLNDGTSYLTSQTQITFGASDPSLPRFDLVVVDTFGLVSIIAGVPAANPLVPSADPGSQIALTSIYIAAGATSLPIYYEMIYDENTEWTTSSTGTIAVDFDDLSNPHANLKAANVTTYDNAASLTFTKPSGQDTLKAGAILKFWIYLKAVFTGSLQVQFFNGSTPVSSRQAVTASDGFQPFDTTQYRNISMIMGNWQTPPTIYNKLVIYPSGSDLSGIGGFYIDEVQVQTGLSPQGKSYVDSVKRVGDSIYYYKQGVPFFASAVGSGGGGSQNLQQVTDIDSLTNHNMIAGDTATQFTAYRDSIYQKKNFTSTTTGLKGYVLWSMKSEKYGINYSPYGKMGEWGSYLVRNYYNPVRPGEIWIRGSYNMNEGGGVKLSGEGGWQDVVESEYNRTVEDYKTMALSNGYIYRPFAMYMKKDTALNDITLRASLFHINPVGVASDILNVQNGSLSIIRVAGVAAVTGARLDLTEPTKNMSILNNSSSMLFSGANFYTFDNHLTSLTTLTYDLGAAAGRWRRGYFGGITVNDVSVPDANYTQLSTDYYLNFKNITANRTLTLITMGIGSILKVTTGQALYKITFAGKTVFNTDGTTATELLAGNACEMEYDGASYQITSLTSVGGGGGSGTVTSIATTSPITGGTITTTGTIGLGTVPIANGGTNNASLGVTAGTVYYGDGSKLVGLAPGTSNQILHGGSTPSWRDTTAAGGGGGGGTPAGNYGNVQLNRNGAFDVAATDSLDYESASGLTLKNTFTSTKTAATAATVYDGFIASNTTTASSGNQMYGGAFHSIGQGWKSNATAASQTADFRWYTIPLSGATVITANLQFDAKIDVGAYTNVMQLSSAGLLTVPTLTVSSGAMTSSDIRSSALTANSNFVTSGSGIGLTSITNAAWNINSKPLQFRVGLRGSTSTAVTAGNDFANLVLGAVDVTEAASGAHALGSNLEVMTPTRTNGTATTTDFQTAYIGDAPTGGDNNWSLNVGSVNHRTKSTWDNTTTTAGTTGNQTINKSSGTVNIAAGGTTVTVTNSLVTATSLVFAVIRTNDANGTSIKSVVPAAGSFVININTAPAAEISIGFFVIN